MKNKLYIHYGHDHYDFKTLELQYKMHKCTGEYSNDNYFLNKPPFGLWASPVECHLSWKNWCFGEDYHIDDFNTNFIFTIKDNAKILYVESTEDVKNYITHKYNEFSVCTREGIIDLKKVMHDFDAMEICHDKDYWDLHTYPGYFNSWDVDSIVVWNPYVILEVKEERLVS